LLGPNRKALGFNLLVGGGPDFGALGVRLLASWLRPLGLALLVLRSSSWLRALGVAVFNPRPALRDIGLAWRSAALRFRGPSRKAWLQSLGRWSSVGGPDVEALGLRLLASWSRGPGLALSVGFALLAPLSSLRGLGIHTSA
jgi:hypothetical protein